MYGSLLPLLFALASLLLRGSARAFLFVGLPGGYLGGGLGSVPGCWGVFPPLLCILYVVLHGFCSLARDLLLDDWTAWPMLREYRLGLGQPKGHSPEESGRALERPPYIK